MLPRQAMNAKLNVSVDDDMIYLYEVFRQASCSDDEMMLPATAYSHARPRSLAAGMDFATIRNAG